MDVDEHSLKRVFFLSEDSRAVQAISDRLAANDVEVVGCPDVGTLTAKMEPVSEAILILDSRVLPQGRDAAFLLSHIESILGDRPVLVYMAHSRDLDLRLQALRADADAFFTSSVPLDELSACLLDLAGAPVGDSYRILVVDDQPVAAIFAARVLERVGMETRIVSDAIKVLEVLEEFRADLVLMDLHMPGANGIELTTLIREHDELYDIPVVFLSSELDSGKQMQALRVGGDDFIAKPVHPEQLIESVRRGLRSFRSRKGRDVAARAGPRVQEGSESRGCSTSGPSGSDAQPDVQLEQLVKEALAADGFHLMHQPILALQQLPSARYETTLRLKVRDGKYVSMPGFLPVARRGGLMPAIDRWLMEQALDALKNHRNEHRHLRFFLHQTMETLDAEDWLAWFRDQIVERDLIMQRPVLQFHLHDLTKDPELAATRLRQLHGLSIKTCLNLPEEGPDGLDLVEDLDIALVRLPSRAATSMKTEQLSRYVDRVHAFGGKVILAGIEQPQTIVRAWSCGVDFIQGDFLQPPSPELSFDFSESVLT